MSIDLLALAQEVRRYEDRLYEIYCDLRNSSHWDSMILAHTASQSCEDLADELEKSDVIPGELVKNSLDTDQ